MKRATRLISAMLTAALLSAPAPAEDFPRGPINLIIPLAPGDAADIAGRAIGDELARLLKTPVVAVNRPGAGGAVGANSLLQAPKDGHTILFAQNSALTFRAVIDPQGVSYHPRKDLVPLGIAVRTPSVLVVRADGPYKRFADLVEGAKKNPGQVRVGHAGAGSVGDFCVQSINALSGASLVSVPFKGAAPALTALRGGHIEGVVLALGALAGQIKDGAFRGLVASSKSPEFPNIPTMRELGHGEDLFGVWLGFLAPAGIPETPRKALV